MSESRPKASWAEYANLASNVAQNVQIGEVQSALKSMSALQAEKVRLEFDEQQTREREDRLREHIWQMENAFNPLVNNPEVTPCAKYVFAMQIQSGLAQFNVTTASFRQFADKDRLGTFINRAQQACQDASNRMSDQQRADADAFLRYQSQAQELDDVVRELQAETDKQNKQLAAAKEQRAAALQALEHWRQMANDPEKQREYDQREQQRQHRARIQGKISLLPVPTIAAWIFGIGFVLSARSSVYDMENEEIVAVNWPALWTGIVILLMAVACTALWVCLSRRSGVKLDPEKTLQEQITIAEAELKSAETVISQIERWLNTSFTPDGVAKFQAKNLTELLQQQQERDVFMGQFRLANNLPRDDSGQADVLSGAVAVAGGTMV